MKMLQSIVLSICVLLTAQLFAPYALDTTFGTTGQIIIDAGGNEGIASVNAMGEVGMYTPINPAIAIDSDNKVVIAGNTTSELGAPLYNAIITRLNADGTVDPSFNSGIIETVNMGQLAGLPQPTYGAFGDVLIQPNGKIVASGSVSTQPFGLPASGFARFNVDGTLDTSFGSGTGVSVLNAVNSFNYAITLGLQSDGKIVGAGCTVTSFESGSENIFVVRLNNDGSLDTTFNSPNGYFVLDLAIIPNFNFPPVEGSLRLVVQPDDKIVVTATTQKPDTTVEYLTLRLTTSGTLDTTFGAPNGYVITDTNNGVPYAICLQNDGKILVGGTSNEKSNFTIIRYESDGTVDTSFGTNGFVTLLPDGFATRIMGLSNLWCNADGTIFFAGGFIAEDDADNSSIVIGRLLDDGTLDGTFSPSGLIFTKLGHVAAFASKFAPQFTDKLVVTGVVGLPATGTDYFVARYAPCPLLPFEAERVFCCSDNQLILGHRGSYRVLVQKVGDDIIESSFKAAPISNTIVGPITMEDFLEMVNAGCGC
jgi:uncharacterized delta-60 repeat protein